MFLHKAMRYYRLWIYSCNLVLLISVLVFVTLAAWALSDYHMALFPSIRLHQPTFVYAYLALVLQGGILQAVGCLGALRMNERLLNFYWSLMLALLVGDMVVGVIWIFHYQQLTAGLSSELRGRLMNQYGVDPHFQLLWDRIQAESRCCGVTGPMDYTNSTWMAQQRLNWPHHHQQVPRSCCRMQWDPAIAEEIPLNYSCVETSQEGQLVHQSGCLEPVHRWLQRHTDILSVLGFCVIAFLKVCFLGILRYEIREMIQKINVLRSMADQQGCSPTGMMPGFEGYIPKSFSTVTMDECCKPNHVNLHNNNLPDLPKDPVKSPNGNNNESLPPEQPNSPQ